jgi:hypothetical protein
VLELDEAELLAAASPLKFPEGDERASEDDEEEDAE